MSKYLRALIFAPANIKMSRNCKLVKFLQQANIL